MDVIIVGGGVIGLGVAWRSLARGLTVTVIDPEPASKASHASAGMLPGGHVALFDQEALLRLCLTSRERYPSFIAELEADSGRPAGYSRYGVLDVAFDEDSLAGLGKLGAFEESYGVSIERLSAGDCLREEPRLAATACGGLLAPDEGAVDPRQLTSALLAAIRRLGGVIVGQAATEVLIGDRASGVRLKDGGTVHGDQIVLAAGCWTNQLVAAPDGAVPVISPGKGQILRFRSAAPFLRRATRALAGGGSVYLVPRADGMLVVGATYEEAGYDTSVTAAGLCELLAKLGGALTGIDELRLEEASAGLRPGSPDGLPVLGETSVPGLLLATGHSHIGVQLTPATSDLMADLLVSGDVPEVIKPFSPLRFC
jgi:glycine oxidase